MNPEKRFFHVLAVGMMALLAVLDLQAQPANDNFANRIVINGAAITTTGSNVGATTESGEPSRVGGARFGATVWWTWTAPASGSVVIDTIGSSFDTVLGVYTGSLGSLNEIASNNNAEGNASRVTFNAQQGTQYQILVGGYRSFFGNPATGSIRLNLSMPPSITITSPANGSVFAVGSPITLMATASAPAGGVIRVDFYRPGSLLGSDTTLPYSLAVSNAPLGTNSFYAVVTDGLSQVATSAVVNVAVLDLGVTITAPADGAVFLDANPITVSVVALLPSGSVTNVDLYVNGQRFGQDSTSPYSGVWTGVTPGMHRFTAVGMDNGGLSYTSAPVYVAVARTLVATGSVWRFLDNGSDYPPGWTTDGFDDSSWGQGPAELGYGDATDGRPEATLVGWGPDENNKYITTYFRHAFTVTNVASYDRLVLRVLRDDGAVVHLNALEAARYNLPAAPTLITFTTTASLANDDGTEFYPADVAASRLVEGPNVLAVEIHQQSVTSSDISFDLELLGVPIIVRNQSPLVSLTSPAHNAYALAPATFPLTATASDPDGSVAKVEFFAGDTKIGESAGPAYGLTWSNVPVGIHTLRAMATDNLGAIATSTPVTVSVYPAGHRMWVAYNDHYAGPGTDIFVSDWNVFGTEGGAPGNAGPLLDNDLGDPVPVTLTISNSGATGDPLSGAPLPGTPAFEMFRYSIDFGSGGGLNHAILIESNDVVTHQFTGLDPARRYRFRGTAVGGQAEYTNRWALFALVDAEGFTAAHTANVLTSTTQPGALAFHEAAMNTGDNLSGDVIGWDDIAPGPDGAVAITATQYLGPAPGNDVPGPYAYGLVALRFEELDASPMVSLTSPAPGEVFEGPTNLMITATASAVTGVTNVYFAANGQWLGSDAIPPYSLVWSNATFGTNTLVAVALDALGRRGWSAEIQVVVKEPPPNTNAPTIYSANPFFGSGITRLTTVGVTFSEPVVGVDAADLLVNGVPATAVIGSGSNYAFTVEQPAQYGVVQISWVADPGILDVGYPQRPFDPAGPGATWTYNLMDLTPPTVVDRSPPAGASITNLRQITVTFSEAVTGVNASDLLVNGVPAISLGGGGSDYTFGFPQPASGQVNISWAAGHGITDLAPAPNSFNANGAGATWSYTLDTRLILVASNAWYRYFKGISEASSPFDAWRQLAFDDSGWSEGQAAFYYDADTPPSYSGNTALTDMQGNYSSVFLRTRFFVLNANQVTNLILRARCDDGYIAWINGVEVWRINMPAGDIPYSGLAANATEPPPLYENNLPDPRGYVQDGTNVLALQLFNTSLGSSDLLLDVDLSTFLADSSTVEPRVLDVSPAAGEVFDLTSITVRFTEPVTRVDASDLRVNGVPATMVTGGSSNEVYTFGFPQPAYGLVTITWDADHGIVDFDPVPKPFDGTAPGSTWQYNLLNPNVPVIAAQTPSAGATVSELTQITVTFSEPVTDVDARDFLVNGIPATGVIGDSAIYVFTFPQPGYGTVTIGWAADHYIEDYDVPANPFDATRSSSIWTYTLVDQTPPAIAAQVPPAGAQVTNLTQVTVTFTEPVSGVNAADLLINGVPATGVSGSGATYTFGFAQPNATLVNVAWANNHGILDLAPAPNAFDPTAPGSTWFYTTPDTLPPAVATIEPPAAATVRTLAQITIHFTEPVTGVSADDLLINSVPAQSVVGSGAGPYAFSFPQPSNGPVEVRWSVSHGIADLATPPNAFGGGEWTYRVDPNASFADKILINEIMLSPASGQPRDEWIELHNTSAELVNLNGWRFTRGLAFTFPNVAIPGHGYLIVAADVAAFRAAYPGVTNVVGPWVGRLSNSDETLELVTSTWELVNRVHYATEGDWAVRQRGRPARLVTSITRSGSTATVYVHGHGYTANDRVLISGADQPEYNGIFSLSSIGVSTFNITIAGAPASPATGWILCRQVVDEGASGWSWFNAADGLGSSLELVNPALPNTWGHNWLASTRRYGTPGAPNSVLASNLAPAILEAQHFPPIPRSSDAVAITARVRDELSNGVASVTLYYRNHSTRPPPAFSSMSMTNLGGGEQADMYRALLPAQANGTVMEFYIHAADNTGLTRIWPAPAWQTNFTYEPTANALYQVDNEPLTNTVPVLRLVMTDTERAEFAAINRQSDAEMNATLISVDGDGTKVRYNCGVRVRGAGTRSDTPTNYRVNIPTDNRWNGLNEINLNSQFVHAQLAGSVLAQKAGLACADARVVQIRVNGANPVTNPSIPANGQGNGAGLSSYVLVEPINGDWAQNHYPNDGDGNVYRASTGNHNANFPSFGTNADQYLGRGYAKTSNQSENDWSDVGSLTFALNNIANDADYVQAVRTNINVEAWMRFFAVGVYLGYGETALFNGIGDDYALYRGMKDPRFLLVAHDFDTILNQGDTTTYWPVVNANIWMMLNPPNTSARTDMTAVIQRFVRHQEFVPVYFGELLRLSECVFEPTQVSALLEQVLRGWGPPETTITSMKNYAINRRTAILSQIPLELTVNHTLGTQNGYVFTSTANVALNGTAHAVDTRRVRVNGNPVTWSAWEARWSGTVTLNPGINRVLVQSFNSNDVETARATLEIWYNDGTVASVSGTVSTDTVWSPSAGPYQVTGSLTVGSGATLTILAGTTVYLGAGVNLTVANGGRLLAEGTATAPIRFTRAPGTATTWGGITINGGAGSPETRITHAHLEFNSAIAIHSAAGTVFLDHLTFGTTDRQYLSLDGSSFVVSDCVFPTPTAAFEPVHGGQGIKSGGRGLFLRNFFGAPNGYNDTIDFTGGNRPGELIVQFINNVFTGSGDDILDLDGTDAWVEGNLFLHVHRNGSPDSASGVSGGNDGTRTSEVTIIGNIFYDVDHAAMAKQGCFYTLINNTIVRQTRQGGEDTEAAVICLADDGTAEAAGMYLEGNIIYDAEQLVRNLTAATVTFSNNSMALPWAGPGGGNDSADPLLNYIPQLAETQFRSWEEAQVMRDWLGLRTGSPARGAGPNGADRGGVVPFGASLAGEPASPTAQNTATLTVGVGRSGSGIPTAGWPNGSGYTHYRWRRDGGAWSAEQPVTTPISLSGLGAGPHTVEVVGRRDSGLYQDDPALGPDATITVSRTWVVDPSVPSLRLNEVLASNDSAVEHEGSYPDAIELYNAGSADVDLEGLRLTDDPQNRDKFTFPAGATLAADAYLVVYANNPDGTSGYHLGFNLDQQGEGVYLYDTPERGGALLDQVVFGPQITDRSIGRLAGGGWALTLPTFGGPNRAAPVGDPSRLRINEWLAIGLGQFANDFVELYNGDALPVALGGLYLTDEWLGLPDRHAIAPLSFIPGYGYLRYVADGDTLQGPDHLNFALSGDQGSLGLFRPDLTPIDCVFYGPQWADISQGRSPNGSGNIVFFTKPTPGGPNPLITAAPPPLVVPIFAMANSWRYDRSGANLDTAWRGTNYDDTTWPMGQALLGYETATLAEPIRTTFTGYSSSIMTYYFRTTFVAPTNENIAGLQITYYLDDGAVFYLNGQECLRLNLEEGPVNYLTSAMSAVGDASLNGPVAVPATALRPGVNLLAVEVHQSGSSSSDIVFGLALDALVITNTSAAGSVVLNEVLANNGNLTEVDGTNAITPDWVELYNQSAGAVELTDLSLTDDSSRPRRWVFPDGTRMPPGGYLRIHCDGNRPASTNNTGFGLKATNGRVYLYDSPTNTGTSLDSIFYGLQVPDLSIGRSPNGTGTNWVLCVPSPDGPNLPVTPMGDPANLRINEWMANPVEPPDWFEIYNTDSRPVALGGLWLSDNTNSPLKHRIADLSFIGTGTNAYRQFIADNTTGGDADHVGFALNQNGEALSIFDTNTMQLCDALTFGSQPTGVSEGRFPDGAPQVVKFWQTASPGRANYRLLTNVVVNEALTHTDPPLEDAIELRNTTDQPIDIGGWWLSDDPGALMKYQIPAPRILQPHGYAVFYQTTFSNRDDVGTAIPFSLSSKGDEVVLSASADNVLTGFRHQVRYGAAENGVSFGRHVTSTGEEQFVALEARTFGVDDPETVEEFRLGAGASNAAPRVGPVVVSEIMYHPPDVGTNDNVLEEYLELHNITTTSVKLYDPAASTNTWHLRDAVDFDLPSGLEIPAGGYLLVVSFNPATEPAALANFRTKYNVDASVPIVGPYQGKLANSTDEIELRKPGEPEAGDAPYILVERIRYWDTYPWPDADGNGLSLQRLDDRLFGNDPVNWTAATPTPGPQAAPLDSDGDGMLDLWEIAYGLDPYNPNDASLDSDGDGLTNLQEHNFGTDPRDARSGLQIESISPAVSGTEVVLTFMAFSNLTYKVDYTETLGGGEWRLLYDLGAASTNRLIQLPTPLSGQTRFYRLRTP